MRVMRRVGLFLAGRGRAQAGLQDRRSARALRFQSDQRRPGTIMNVCIRCNGRGWLITIPVSDHRLCCPRCDGSGLEPIGRKL